MNEQMEQSEFTSDPAFDEFKNRIQRGKRMRGLLLAVISVVVLMIIWGVALIRQASSNTAHAAERLEITVGELTYVEGAYIAFDISIQNNSDFDIWGADMRLHFSDRASGRTLGILETELATTIPPAETKLFDGKLNGSNFNKAAYAYLTTANLSEIAVDVELTEAMFSDGVTMDYEDGTSLGMGYILLIGLTVGVLCGWSVHVFKNTYCKACHAVMTVKSRGRRELGREAASWDEKHEVKNKKGEAVYTYDEQVSGDRILHEYKRVCSCCGNVTYRRAAEYRKNKEPSAERQPRKFEKPADMEPCLRAFLL